MRLRTAVIAMGLAGVIGVVAAVPGAFADSPSPSRIELPERSRPVKIHPPDPRAYLHRLQAETARTRATNEEPPSAPLPPRPSERRIDRTLPETAIPSSRSSLNDATPREEPLVRAEDQQARLETVRQRRDKVASEKRLITEP